MCGIYGYMNTKREPDLRKLVELGLLASTRGNDASGMAWIHGRNQIRSVRIAENLPRTELSMWMRPLKSRVMIGHCRWTTVGDSKIAPHPFVGKGVATAHNGTIWDYKKIAEEVEVRLTGDCDSEILMRIVEKHRRRGATLRDAMRVAIDKVPKTSPIALLVMTPTVFGAYANNYPLFMSKTGYFAQKLPTWGRWKDLSDGEPRVFPVQWAA